MDLSRLVALIAFAGAVVPASPALAACEVRVRSFEFAPSSKTVPVGSTVEWCWEDGGHSVTGSFGDSGVLAADDTFAHTFNQPGTFSYVCSEHELTMTGSITVQGASPSKTASPTTKPTTKPPTTPPATTRPPTTAPAVTRTPTPTTAPPTTVAPTTPPPTTDPPTTAPATPSTSPAALDIDPAPAKPKTGLAIVLGLVVAAGAFGTLGWLLLKGRSG